LTLEYFKIDKSDIKVIDGIEKLEEALDELDKISIIFIDGEWVSHH